MNSTYHSPDSLSTRIDYADRQTLERYEDGRVWFLVVDEDLPLENFAWTSLYSPQQVQDYLQSGAVQLHRTLETLPGEDFDCIYLENAYILKPDQKG